MDAKIKKLLILVALAGAIVFVASRGGHKEQRNQNRKPSVQNSTPGNDVTNPVDTGDTQISVAEKPDSEAAQPKIQIISREELRNLQKGLDYLDRIKNSSQLKEDYDLWGTYVPDLPDCESSPLTCLHYIFKSSRWTKNWPSFRAIIWILSKVEDHLDSLNRERVIETKEHLLDLVKGVKIDIIIDNRSKDTVRCCMYPVPPGRKVKMNPIDYRGLFESSSFIDLQVGGKTISFDLMEISENSKIMKKGNVTLKLDARKNRITITVE